MRGILLIGGLVFSLSHIQAQNYYYNTQSTGAGIQEGIAVYYADYLHGKKTALGETYRMEEFTAAHKTLPQGTLVQVTRLDNGQSVVVRINDRGPFDPGVMIDLSKAAALKIGLVKKGRARVRLETVGNSNTNPVNGLLPGTPQNPYASSSYTTKGAATNPPSSPTGYGYRPETTPTGYSYSNAPSNSRAGYNPTLSPGLTGYAVQLASYSNLQNARNQLDQLGQRGMQNLYLWEKSGYYKIVIAPFASKGAAAAHLEQLKRQYLQDGIVVRLK